MEAGIDSRIPILSRNVGFYSGPGDRQDLFLWRYVIRFNCDEHAYHAHHVGYSNAEFVPYSNSVARSHYDLWQLKIDTPGGQWDPADYKMDVRAETMVCCIAYSAPECSSLAI